MKKFSFLFFALLFSACAHPDFTLDMTVADGYDFNGHQAYLLGYYDTNCAVWLDSVRIADNHATFRTKMPYDEMLCEVIIADCPTSFRQFRFARGERASFMFNPDLQTLYPPVEGSEASAEIADYMEEIRAGMQKQRALNMALMAEKAGSHRAEELRQELEKVSADRRSLSVELLSGTKSFLNAFSACFMLFDLPADSLAKIKEELLRRWPDDVNRSMLTGVSALTGDSIREMSLPTKAVLNRRAVLLGDLPPYPAESQEGSAVASAKTSVYGPGDLVADFSLPDRNGNAVAWSSLATPYVLLDFWASWCGPCREEVPSLLAAVRDYGEELSVYAVSMWRSIYGATPCASGSKRFRKTIRKILSYKWLFPTTPNSMRWIAGRRRYESSRNITATITRCRRCASGVISHAKGFRCWVSAMLRSRLGFAQLG